MYGGDGNRDRFVKLRVTDDEWEQWKAAAKRRDARERIDRGGWPGLYRGEGLSGFIRAAIETAIKNGSSRAVATKRDRPGGRRRRGHKRSRARR